MTDQKISEFPVGSYNANIWIPAIDTALASGSQNIKMEGSALAAAFASASSSGNSPVVSSPPDGITVDASSFDGSGNYLTGQNDVLLFTLTASDSDVFILNVEFKATTYFAPTYNFQLYFGNPASGGQMRYDYYTYTGLIVGQDGATDFHYSTPIYLPNNGSGTEVWLRIQNKSNPVVTTPPYVSPFFLNAQVVLLEFEGHGKTFPGFTPPARYTGPLMDTVFVGPTRQFTEPRIGLQAIADGGTMYIDPGMYYLPFGMTTDPDRASHPNFGPNPNSPTAVNGVGGADRFYQGITIIGSGTYGATPTVFNGLGGYGVGPTFPYRLTAGQGFCYTEVPLTITDCRFMWCGGFDQSSDGEAAIYCSGFGIRPTQGEYIVHVLRCAFDANENGLFSQYWHGEFPTSEHDISDATGRCRYLTITIENCDFGYLLPNGAAGDGYSSDFYLNNMTINVLNSNFYGDITPLPWRSVQTEAGYHGGSLGGQSTSGNEMKCRGRYLTVDNCWLRSESGKLIDRCDGGSLIVTNSTFSNFVDSQSLVMAYNSENSYPIPLSNPTFTDCTFYFSASRHVIWWLLAPLPIIFDMVNCTYYWSSPSIQVLPQRDIRSSGGVDPGVIPSWNLPEGDTNIGFSAPPDTIFRPNPPAPHPASFAGDPILPPLNP